MQRTVTHLIFSLTLLIRALLCSDIQRDIASGPLFYKFIAFEKVHHATKLCEKEAKSIWTVRQLEPCWKGTICYVNPSENQCIKEKAVDKLKDQLDQVDELKITHAAIYKVPLLEDLPSDYGFLYHAFVVFHTSPESRSGSWWSIEKTFRSLVAQRSRFKEEILDFRDGEKRWETPRGLPRVLIEDSSSMSLQDFLVFLQDSGELNHDYHGMNANCQDFAKKIFNKLALSMSAW